MQYLFRLPTDWNNYSIASYANFRNNIILRIDFLRENMFTVRENFHETLRENFIVCVNVIVYIFPIRIFYEVLVYTQLLYTLLCAYLYTHVHMHTFVVHVHLYTFVVHVGTHTRTRIMQQYTF